MPYFVILIAFLVIAGIGFLLKLMGIIMLPSFVIIAPPILFTLVIVGATIYSLNPYTKNKTRRIKK